MSELPELNFPPIRLRARRRRDQVEVWDDLRGIWLVLTPEEWVRRHLIACLVAHCGAPARRIVQEVRRGAQRTAAAGRCGGGGRCGGAAAAGRVQGSRSKIDARVLDQAVRYNSVLGARYLVLTNGLTHRCYACSPGGGYAALEHSSPALTQRLPHARFPAAFPKQHPAARAGFAAPDKSRSETNPPHRG